MFSHLQCHFKIYIDSQGNATVKCILLHTPRLQGKPLRTQNTKLQVIDCVIKSSADVILPLKVIEKQ